MTPDVVIVAIFFILYSIHEIIQISIKKRITQKFMEDLHHQFDKEKEAQK